MNQERAEALDLARAIAPERPTRPWAWSASDWLQVAHKVAAALLATNEELGSAQAEYRRLREAAQSVVDSWHQNHAGNDANGAGHVGNSALESLAAALSEAPATEGSHAPDCALALNARHGCTCHVSAHPGEGT